MWSLVVGAIDNTPFDEQVFHFLCAHFISGDKLTKPNYSVVCFAVLAKHKRWQAPYVEPLSHERCFFGIDFHKACIPMLWSKRPQMLVHNFAPPSTFAPEMHHHSFAFLCTIE